MSSLYKSRQPRKQDSAPFDGTNSGDQYSSSSSSAPSVVSNEKNHFHPEAALGIMGNFVPLERPLEDYHSEDPENDDV